MRYNRYSRVWYEYYADDGAIRQDVVYCEKPVLTYNAAELEAIHDANVMHRAFCRVSKILSIQEREFAKNEVVQND